MSLVACWCHWLPVGVHGCLLVSLVSCWRHWLLADVADCLLVSLDASWCQFVACTQLSGELWVAQLLFPLIGKRHATRLMCDAYGKGIVRGQAENTNLRVNGKTNDVTAAETFRTCLTASFFGKEYYELVQRICGATVVVHTSIFAEVDARNPRKKKVIVRDVAVLYGQRPASLMV